MSLFNIYNFFLPSNRINQNVTAVVYIASMQISFPLSKLPLNDRAIEANCFAKVRYYCIYFSLLNNPLKSF